MSDKKQQTNLLKKKKFLQPAKGLAFKALIYRASHRLSDDTIRARELLGVKMREPPAVEKEEAVAIDEALRSREMIEIMAQTFMRDYIKKMQL